MPRFSRSSQRKLDTCDPRLIIVFTEVVKTWDCTIVCGHRGKEAQDKAYSEGKSMLKFPESKHNTSPSVAIDVAPYYNGVGIDWSDTIGFAYFAGYVLRVAEEQGVKLRWGGDWDGDKRNKDQSFNDLPHWEVID